MKVTRRIKATRSTGNVFRDLGFPAAEATRLLVRADLLIEIERIAKARRLTSQSLAETLAVSRRRIDDLRRGRLRRFGTDALIDMLSRLDADVRLVVHLTTRRHLPGVRERSKARRQLRRLRRPIPSGFAFDREEANRRGLDD